MPFIPMRSPLTVLIADDSKLARKLLRKQVLLASQGCSIFEARDGAEALSIFKERRPTVTFLDIHMPEKSGIEVLQDIRQLDANAYVALVSADRSPARAQQAQQLAASDTIAKPYSPRQIQQALKQAMTPRSVTKTVTSHRLLVVDDSRTHRQIMKKIIGGLNIPCDVDEAGDGGEAITRYFENDYGLVLLDVNMPRLGGLVALEEIMLKDPAANVVMVSASQDQDIIQECTGLGAKDFLYKPVCPDRLRAALLGDDVVAA